MKNKLVPAIVIGAAVGGLIALIDKGTRESLVSNTKSINITQRILMILNSVLMNRQANRLKSI